MQEYSNITIRSIINFRLANDLVYKVLPQNLNQIWILTESKLYIQTASLHILKFGWSPRPLGSFYTKVFWRRTRFLALYMFHKYVKLTYFPWFSSWLMVHVSFIQHAKRSFWIPLPSVSISRKSWFSPFEV